MIDLDKLKAGFLEKIRKQPAASLIASESTCFESWFRAELAVALLGQGILRETIAFNYAYPRARRLRADLAVGARIVFELKCFSYGADANKIQEFPRQVQLLEDHTGNGEMDQAVCFASFFGYTPQRLQMLCDRFWPSTSGWKVLGPSILVPNEKMTVVFAGLVRGTGDREERVSTTNHTPAERVSGDRSTPALAAMPECAAAGNLHVEVPGQMNMDEIRGWIRTNCLEPALGQDGATVEFRAGDLHARMGLRARVPMVCNAMDQMPKYFTDFRIVGRRGIPPPRSNYWVTYARA